MVTKIGKVKIFFISIIYRVHNIPSYHRLLEIALSLKVFEIINIFHFWQNLRWQPEFRKLKIFHRHYIQGLEYLKGPKFPQNHSISNYFQGNSHFSFMPEVIPQICPLEGCHWCLS